MKVGFTCIGLEQAIQRGERKIGSNFSRIKQEIFLLATSFPRLSPPHVGLGGRKLSVYFVNPSEPAFSATTTGLEEGKREGGVREEGGRRTAEGMKRN